MITAGGIQCRIVTPELANALHAIGEDVASLNRIAWPAGASRWAEGVLLMHSTDAAALAGKGRATAFDIVLDDVVISGMYQGQHRPIHVRGGNKLVAVTVRDARYYLQGNSATKDENSDLTIATDRSTVITATGAPDSWNDLFTSITTKLGISVTGTLDGNGNPYDYVVDGEPMTRLLDRLCAASGQVFIHDYEDGTYKIVNPTTLNGSTSDWSDDVVAGGVVWDATTADGKATLNAEMPSTVSVMFPRAVFKTDKAATLTETAQFFTCTSTSGKPSGVTGRSGQQVVIHDNLWALGDNASADPTNKTALQARADDLATRYYRRYSVEKLNVRLRGFAAVGNVPGVITWALTGGGPFTDVHTDENWYAYGMVSDVGGGFLDKHVAGLDGILALKTADGGLRIAYNSTRETKYLARITGHAVKSSSSVAVGGGGAVTVEYRWKYAFTEVQRDGDGVADVSGGRSGTTGGSGTTIYAMNTRETNHTGTYSWGVDITSTSYPTGFRPQAIGCAGALTAGSPTHRYDDVVEITEVIDKNGTMVRWFSAMGSHDGTCT